MNSAFPYRPDAIFEKTVLQFMIADFIQITEKPMPATVPLPSSSTASSLEPRAVELWRQRIRMETEANYHYEMGVAIAREGNLPAAAEAFRRALGIKPAYPEASWQLTELLQRLGQTGQAQAVHEDARARRADYASFALCRLGQQAFLDGNTNRAVELFDRAAQYGPEPPEAILWRDLAHAARDHAPLSPVSDGAIAAVSAAEAAELSVGHARVARDLMNKGHVSLAETIARRAAVLDPLVYEASNLVSVLLFYTGRYSEAARWSRRALTIEPANASLLVQDGLSHCYLGNFRGGEVSLRRAANLDPGDMSAYGNLGFALRKQERYAEAVAAFQRAAELPPPTAWIHGEMARAYRDMGDLKEAAEAYRKGVALVGSTAGYEWMQSELDDVLSRLG